MERRDRIWCDVAADKRRHQLARCDEWRDRGLEPETCQCRRAPRTSLGLEASAIPGHQARLEAPNRRPQKKSLAFIGRTLTVRFRNTKSSWKLSAREEPGNKGEPRQCLPIRKIAA